MDPWSNIDVSPKDTEVAEIDQFEGTLNNIPASVLKIRELITRFEICHFKYLQHLKYISDSINNLEPSFDPVEIGSKHIRHGENAWRNDKTRRSLTGQQYLWVLSNWLSGKRLEIIPERYDKDLDQMISKWLGKKTPEKKRLVRLLIARLTYDWGSYEKLRTGGQFVDLEYQACRMDICHYAFPAHLDKLLQCIGKMKPAENPEGCGSFDSARKEVAVKKFKELCSRVNSINTSGNVQARNKDERLKVWLYACLAKTLKAQVGLTISSPKLP